MKSMKFLIVILLASFGIISASTLYAQTETPPTPEILKRVLSLGGKWEGKATMQMGGKRKNVQFSIFHALPENSRWQRALHG